jgi:hypothetical protein
MWVDRGLSVRHGDLAQWHFPSTGEYCAKYLLDVDGVDWLACKTGARVRLGDERLIGRVVMTIRGKGPNLVDPSASAALAEDARMLRANPPKHRDFCVFAEDLFDHEQMRVAIRAHVARTVIVDSPHVFMR